MRNILVHMLIDPHSEYDIFNKTNYVEMSDTFRRKKTSCPNLGNRLWFQGLVSEISGDENKITYFREDMSKDYINETFDLIVAPMANVFHVAFSGLLQHLAERFRGIRIPVYVIACGVQADSYAGLGDLCSAISPSAREFMKSVYDTGGEFALRGYFTKEFFDRMGFSSAVVTGCPSLYQLGRNLRISEEKVSYEEFRPLINGDANDYLPLAKPFPDAEFFDQERFFHILHDPCYVRSLRDLVHQYGYETTRWLLSGKVKMIPNMNDWWNYLQNSGFHFSYGSRIHGSIMPILAGIPAAMDPQDARTQEMAEFFEIPIVGRKSRSLYDIYLEADYSAFNKNFAKKFNAYEHFLVSHGIVDQCNQHNAFFHCDEVAVAAGNSHRLEKMNRDFQHHRLFIKGYDGMLRLKRRISEKG